MRALTRKVNVERLRMQSVKKAIFDVDPNDVHFYLNGTAATWSGDRADANKSVH